MKIYSVIMAGGGGTRFWPLSRQTQPKQFLNITGNDAMINETIRRVESLIPPEDTYIVINKTHTVELSKVLMKGVPKNNVLVEPFARNTAPCILYAAMHIIETAQDGVMCVFPADHYISDKVSYVKALKKAINIANRNEILVAMGINPTFAATGYGYIKAKEDKKISEGFVIESFVEKPQLSEAQKYLQDGGYYWNGGMFICKASVIVALFERYLSKMYKSMIKMKSHFGTETVETALAVVYDEIDNVSFDYGIMERLDNAAVVTGDFDWSDVGSWDALDSLYPADENGNIINAEFIGVDSKNCVVFSGMEKSEKLIATIGLNEIVIIDTADALLVCDKGSTQDIRKIVEIIKSREMFSKL